MTATEVHRNRFTALGTVCEILTADPNAAEVARAEVAAEVARCDVACSRFRQDSDLSRLNAGAGHEVEVSDRLLDDLQAALGAAEVTDGVVDPTIGKALVVLGYDRDFDLVAAAGSAESAWSPVPPGPPGPPALRHPGRHG